MSARRSRMGLGGVSLRMLGTLLWALLLPAAAVSASEAADFNAPGSYIFTVPLGVSEITVETWGGGGAGGDAAPFSATVGGGGGGGAYARSTLAVSAGQTYTLVVGAGSTSTARGGDSWFGSTGTVLARGGNSVSNGSSSGASGGAASLSVGDVRRSGGNGANGATPFLGANTGGGGGGSAGPNQNGNNASGRNGAAGVSGGGGGGNGGSTLALFDSGSPGGFPGGGGGGAARCSGCIYFPDGGRGGHGRVRVSYTVTEPVACFSDNFNRASLGEADWATSITAGTFMPQIVSNRLRMTQASTQQSTSATLQRLIPGAGNYVVLEFDYFAYGGTRADGVAITLSDAAVSPQPGSFGGALGYAQRDDGTPGFAGGWLGIGLDEYGNFPRAAEGRVGGTGTTVAQNVSLRGSGSGLTGYRYITHVGPLSPAVDGTGSVTPHRYRIELNATTGGQALVQVFRNTGSGMTPLIGPVNMLAQAGQAALPEKLMLSITGSTGDLTNVHEFDNLQICALALEEVNEYIDHFELRHPGLGLTCQPTPVDILACLDAECTELYTGEVTATLSPSGWVGGDTVTFSGGMTTALFQRTSLAPGNPVLGVATSSPMVRPLTNNSCRSGGAGPSPALCELPMVDAGLLVSVPDLVANRPEANAEIRAVRQDDQTLACVPAFEHVTKPVRFWSDYVVPGPAGRPVSWPVAVNGEPVGLTAATQTPVEVSFGAGGVAAITVAYPDAGRVQLNARYLGSEERGDAGLDMPGVSVPFTSRPAGLCVLADGPCASADASCPLFRRAGEAFDLTLRAVGWLADDDPDLCSGNPPTPNFELSGIGLSSELISPVDGVAGGLAPTSYNHQRHVTGETTVAVSQSEVGVFHFRATPGNYLGGVQAGGLSGPVGRFYPDHFLVTEDPGTLAASCEVTAPFTYTGQPFGWAVRPSLQIAARAVGGGVTQNYTQPGYQRLTAPGINLAAPLTDALAQGTDGVLLPVSAALEAGQLTVQGPGLLVYVFSDLDRLWYDKAPVARVAPFVPSLPFTLASVTDADGVQALALPRAMTPEAGFELRYGRLTMDNVFGPETATALAMPFRAEFWSGTRYQINAADGCSPWDSADVDGTLDHHTRTPASGLLVAGEGEPLILHPAGSTGTDSLNWSVPVWLQDDWTGSGVLSGPTALATFGVFRGHDRIIYWREVGN